ncbi:hypothetical protein [Methanothrix soehngenii]|jgi:hypothetical protein|uniref:hypothetical protein n=1 Tax=Methanothrix soehngenii TaxID=2223 RepID=UPI0023F07413|nr:hypothetical protein [Methanothrix soehngenii]MCK9586893.1 hypothetical protein [Methanothrix soehngenii]MDD5256894.1 hypothetical protein [Methanothrix soehngenii]
MKEYIAGLSGAKVILKEHLGGSYQPIGQDFAGANLTVPAGSNQVPGLEEALKAFLNKG